MLKDAAEKAYKARLALAPPSTFRSKAAYFLEHVRKHDRVWFCTGRDVAEHAGIELCGVEILPQHDDVVVEVLPAVEVFGIVRYADRLAGGEHHGGGGRHVLEFIGDDVAIPGETPECDPVRIVCHCLPANHLKRAGVPLGRVYVAHVTKPGCGERHHSPAMRSGPCAFTTRLVTRRHVRRIGGPSGTDATTFAGSGASKISSGRAAGTGREGLGGGVLVEGRAASARSAASLFSAASRSESSSASLNIWLAFSLISEASIVREQSAFKPIQDRLRGASESLRDEAMELARLAERAGRKPRENCRRAPPAAAR